MYITNCYQCTVCGYTKEVIHRRSEEDNPSVEFLKKTTCGGVRFKKLISMPNYSKFNSMSRHEKNKVLKQRARQHFDKEKDKRIEIDKKTKI